MADENTPLVGENEDDGHATRAKKSVQELHRTITDHHTQVMGHATKASTIPHLHEEGEAPSWDEAQAAHTAFLMTTGPILCCAGSLFALVGYLAIKYSAEESPGKCPFPLSKILYYYGILILCMAAMMFCTIAFPPCLMCNSTAQMGCQCIGLAMLITTLMSYSSAHECGMTLWWACLFFANPMIACLVFCCCSPAGAAKAAAFLGYKAAVAKAAVAKVPTYKTTASFAHHPTPV